MRIFLLFFMAVTMIFAYTDSDLDGVDDAMDRCPNTPITDLVDIKGCSIESLKSPHHYNIVIGESYSQIDYNTNEKTDTYTTTLQLEYFYKDISLQASSSYYTSESQSYSSEGMNDTSLAAYYLVRISDDFRIRLGAGVILPTYESDLNNNKTDYLGSINASYSFERMNLFAGYSFTKVNDENIPNLVSYQNTHAYNAGLGYYLSAKWYASASYYQADSIYVNIETTKSASIYSFYSLDAHWFTTFSYAYGLSDSASDHSASLRLGYSF